MKPETPRQIKRAIEDIQYIVDKKKEELKAEPDRLKRNLLRNQIEGRERTIQQLQSQS